jgi:rare lipoprotein A
MIKKQIGIILFLALLVSACHRKSILGGTGKTVTEKGLASFYSDKFEGSETANGEIFHQSKYTAAHKKLPYGTMIKVTNLSNDKSVIVRINDRGPFVTGRIIDLSRSAALKIQMVDEGIVKVKIEYKQN